MIVFRNLRPSTMIERNFIDFDNMFCGIDCKDSAASYIALSIIDAVKLECNPSRLNDVYIWFSEGEYLENRGRTQTYSNNIIDDSNVDDIED